MAAATNALASVFWEQYGAMGRMTDAWPLSTAAISAALASLCVALRVRRASKRSSTSPMRAAWIAAGACELWEREYQTDVANTAQHSTHLTGPHVGLGLD